MQNNLNHTAAPVPASEAASARDMAIAQAVRQACCMCVETSVSLEHAVDLMGHLELSKVIRLNVAAPAAPTDAKAAKGQS